MPNIPNELSLAELKTEVKRLWHHEVFFNASQKLAHFGYCEWDYVGEKIISCTPAYAEIFGMTVEEVIESQSSWQKVIEQLHPEDRENYRESYKSHLCKGSRQAQTGGPNRQTGLLAL